MELTQEQKDNIKLLGSAFRPPESIANYLGIPLFEAKRLLKEPGNDIFIAYWPALEVQAAKLYNSIIEAALRDSSPAQLQAVKLLEKLMTKLKPNA